MRRTHPAPFRQAPFRQAPFRQAQSRPAPRPALIAAAALLLSVLALSCVAAPSARADGLMMATTTSTDNTGLLDALAPQFKADTGITLKWSAMGTGKALQFGRDCNCDVLLVHAPPAEKAFVAQGFGVDRTELMYNDFVIIGPGADPAGAAGLPVVRALEAVARAGAGGEALFVSRGDDSGTNAKELALWERSVDLDTPDREPWYVQSGQGMLATILMAQELSAMKTPAYTLTDRGTYITYAAAGDGQPPLVILVEGDPSLFNQYSAIAVNPEACPGVRHDLATAFIDWMASDRAQALIADFRLLGRPLFTPNAE
jgi:tungstate transport system substrate-binding protein